MMFVTVVASHLLSIAAAGVSEDVLQPKGKWVVDWSESHCTAQIPYDVSGKEQQILIKASPLDETYSLFFVRPGQVAGATQYEAKLAIGDQPQAKVTTLTYSIDKHVVEAVNLSKAQSDNLVAASSVSLGHVSKGKTYALPHFAKVIATIQKCRKDLVATWNGGEVGAAKLKTRADGGNLLSVFKPTDYPRQAVRNAMGGTTQLALLVDEKGKIIDCTVEQTSGIAVLDAQSCAVVTARAQLKPATDLNGAPARDIVRQRISWVTR